jgi:hypothetical protein
VYYSEDYFLSITQRLGKKTIYGWTLERVEKTVDSDTYNYCCQYQNEYQLIGIKATHI